MKRGEAGEAFMDFAFIRKWRKEEGEAQNKAS